MLEQSSTLYIKAIKSSTQQYTNHNVQHPTKLARHLKKQKNVVNNMKKNKSVKTDTEMTEMV